MDGYFGATDFNCQFYGDIEDEIFATPTLSAGRPAQMDIAEALRLLKAAKYPVIVSGGGVSQGDALDEVRALAEYLSAPVVNTYAYRCSMWPSRSCGPMHSRI